MHENLPLPPDEPSKLGQPAASDSFGSPAKPAQAPASDPYLIPIVNMPQAAPVAKKHAVNLIWQKYGHVLIAFVIAGILVGGTIVYLSMQERAYIPFTRSNMPPVEVARNPAALTPGAGSEINSASVKKTSKSSATRKKGVKRAKSKPKPWLSK